MRVNPNITPDLLASLALTQQEAQTALGQISSGRRVQVPSDDPAAAAVLIINHSQTAQATQFQQTISNVSARLQVADSTLGSVTTVVERALSLGIEAANGTLSDSNRASIAEELRGLQQQLISLANTSFQGTYLFAGTKSLAPPFVADGTQLSGVRYDGNINTNAVQIGDSFQLQTNLPGSQLFQAAGGDVFQSIQTLITAVSTNTAIDTAVTGTRVAFDALSSQRVFYGNALQQLQAQQTFLGTEKVQLHQQENTIGGADLAAAVTQLTNAQTARNTTLQAVGTITKVSLFDFLR